MTVLWALAQRRWVKIHNDFQVERLFDPLSDPFCTVRQIFTRGNFYPETLVKEFKSRAWIRFFIRICEDFIFGVFFYSCAKQAFSDTKSYPRVILTANIFLIPRSQ